jgi:hypothetical protein
MLFLTQKGRTTLRLARVIFFPQIFCLIPSHKTTMVLFSDNFIGLKKGNYFVLSRQKILLTIQNNVNKVY